MKCCGGIPAQRARRAGERAGGALLVLAVLALGAAPGVRASPGGLPAAVHGKVGREGSGVPGARVYAFRSFSDALADRWLAASEPSGPDGGYRLQMTEGTCYLVAKKGWGGAEGPLAAGGLHAYHGSNPFTLTAGSDTEVNFSLARKAAGPAVQPGDDPGSGSLGGVVTWRGAPVEGAYVKLYLDAQSDFRGAGYAAAPPTDAQGTFRFDFLPDSVYFVVAAKRAGGAGAGPIGAGDLYGFLPDNPVRVRPGTSVEVELELVSKGRDVPGADARPRPSGTRISGRITDGAGGVVRGVYAFAYEERVMSHRKPAFLSEEVDAEGRYVIHLSRGGTYYIGARSAYGDSPMKGEWYGKYDGSPDHGVTVAEGSTRDGVDIVVERILP